MPSGKRLEGCRFRLAIQVWIIPLTRRTLLPRHLSVVPRLSVRRRDHWAVEPRLLACRRLLAIFVACSPSDLLFFVGRGVNTVVRWPFLLPFPQHLVCLQILINVGWTSEGTAPRHADQRLVSFRSAAS